MSPGLPFSDECEQALTNAREEAVLLGSKQTDLEHLLLRLLREQGCYAARILRERGAELDHIRKAFAVPPVSLPQIREIPATRSARTPRKATGFALRQG